MSNFLINVRLNNIQAEIDLLKLAAGLTNPLQPDEPLDCNGNNLTNGNDFYTNRDLVAGYTQYSGGQPNTPEPPTPVGSVRFASVSVPYKGTTYTNLVTYQPIDPVNQRGGIGAEIKDTYYSPVGKSISVASVPLSGIVNLNQVPIAPVSFNGETYDRMLTLIEFPFNNGPSSYNDPVLSFTQLQFTLFAGDPPAGFGFTCNFALVATLGDDANPFTIIAANQNSFTGDNPPKNNDFNFQNIILQTLYNGSGSKANSIKLSIVLQSLFNTDWPLYISGDYWLATGFTGSVSSTSYTSSCTPVVGGL
jgi:hypothetical protein